MQGICSKMTLRHADAVLLRVDRFLYKTEHTMGGSLRWMAPEIATGHWAWNKVSQSVAMALPLCSASFTSKL